MRKSKKANNKEKNLINYLHGKFIAIILIIFIIIISFILDYLNSGSLFTLATILSISLSGIITHWAIPKLKNLKFKQVIRKEGPIEHYKKAGTPTMGGLFIVPIGLLIGNLAILPNTNREEILAISFLMLSYMLIGMIDDLKSFSLNINKGLSAKEKLILQSISGIIFISWAAWQQLISTQIYLFAERSIDIGFFIWPLALFVLLAESNATNLTDGLDGLASGCGALVFTGLAIQIMLRQDSIDPMLSIFCMAMAGTWLGFLVHNRKPAKIFMGDTGSLAMGAGLSGIALISNSLWPLLIMGGVFFAESLSVIIQVWVFKITKKIYGEGKRVFKMAPIHHHFELTGHNEEAIVKNFWITTLVLVILGIIVRPTS